MRLSHASCEMQFYKDCSTIKCHMLWLYSCLYICNEKSMLRLREEIEVLATVKACGAQVHASVIEHSVSVNFASQCHARYINKNHSSDLSKAAEEVGVRLGLELI